MALQWRHNGRNSVSNHQPHGCILNVLTRRRSKKTSKLRVTGLCAGNSPGTVEFPAQMASNTENVSIWWRHHGISDRGHHIYCKSLGPFFLSIAKQAPLYLLKVAMNDIYSTFILWNVKLPLIWHSIVNKYTNLAVWSSSVVCRKEINPDSKVHGANMGPTWVLSAPDWPMLAPWTFLSRYAMFFTH